MDALQFYVGRWTCLERKASDPPLSSTFTFAIESNLSATTAPLKLSTRLESGTYNHAIERFPVVAANRRNRFCCTAIKPAF
jgi:hypothetical protein